MAGGGRVRVLKDHLFHHKGAVAAAGASLYVVSEQLLFNNLVYF